MIERKVREMERNSERDGERKRVKEKKRERSLTNEENHRHRDIHPILLQSHLVN